jgi:hypothetical protein
LTIIQQSSMKTKTLSLKERVEKDVDMVESILLVASIEANYERDVGVEA